VPFELSRGLEIPVKEELPSAALRTDVAAAMGISEPMNAAANEKTA